MKGDFVKDFPDKTHFTYDEILKQSISDGIKYTGDYYKQKQEAINHILKNLNIDVSAFKQKDNKYYFPILFAEIIYIIAKDLENNPTKFSITSKLKRNRIEELSFDDRLSFMIEIFTELKKDYPSYKSIIDETACYFLYPYYNVKDLTICIEKLNDMIQNIELPLISYNPNQNKLLHDFLKTDQGKKFIENNVQEYNSNISEYEEQLIEQLLSIDSSNKIMTPTDELDKQIEIIKNEIDKLQNILKNI